MNCLSGKDEIFYLTMKIIGILLRLAMMEKKNNNPEREAKNREFQETMQEIEMQSAKRLHSIKSKKRELRGAQRESKKKVEKLKEVRT